MPMRITPDRFQRNLGFEIRALALSCRLHSRLPFKPGIAYHPVQFSGTTSLDRGVSQPYRLRAAG
jgi:hypothetical protein